MEKRSDNHSKTDSLDKSEDDSFDYDEYVIGDDLDIMKQKEIQTQMENAKTKMKRTVAKKFTGFFKGFINKASQKMKSSIYRSKIRHTKNRTQSLQEPLDDGRVSLADDPEDMERKSSVYS